MDLSPKRICQILKDNGWELDRIKGSHHIYMLTIGLFMAGLILVGIMTV